MEIMQESIYKGEVAMYKSNDIHNSDGGNKGNFEKCGGNKMKKLVSIISAIAMLIVTSNFVLADDAYNSENVIGDFVYQEDTNTIVAYVGKTGICEIPENTTLKGLTPSWAENTPITKLIINDNVNIDMVLSGELVKFNELKEVELKEGVTEVPYEFLENCKKLEKVTLPSTIKTIDDGAFRNCKSLKSITLNDGIQSIGEYAFAETALSGNLNIPDSVTQMDVTAFSDCGSFDKVHMSNNIECEKDKEYQWFSGTEIGEINIPDTMLNYDNCYFHGDEITFNSDMSVKIYNMVRGSNWCDLKYLKGKTDKSLGKYDGFAIAENTVLRYIGTDKNPTVPDGITAIGKMAFTYCDIDTVTLPKSLNEIDETAFYLSTIKNITIPENVKVIGDNAFDYCPLLEKVEMNGNPKIGENAIVVSDALSEDNIVVNSAETKKKIVSFGVNQYELSAFYDLLNKNREKIGWEKVQTITSTLKPDTTIIPTVAPTQEPSSTISPIATPTQEPSSTVEPTTPKKLTVKSGDELTVGVNGENVTFPDAKPFVDENGRTQVPIRAVSEMLDCKVDWDDITKTAVITKDNGDVVKVTLGSDILLMNGKTTKMDTTAIIKEERTFIPVRFVAEAMGLEVEWVE